MKYILKIIEIISSLILIYLVIFNQGIDKQIDIWLVNYIVLNSSIIFQFYFNKINNRINLKIINYFSILMFFLIILNVYCFFDNNFAVKNLALIAYSVIFLLLIGLNSIKESYFKKLPKLKSILFNKITEN